VEHHADRQRATTPAGPASAIARASMRDSDRRLGVWLDLVEERGLLDDVVVLLTADHGSEGADPAAPATGTPRWPRRHPVPRRGLRLPLPRRGRRRARAQPSSPDAACRNGVAGHGLRLRAVPPVRTMCDRSAAS
jgi:hypothetical protein